MERGVSRNKVDSLLFDIFTHGLYLMKEENTPTNRKKHESKLSNYEVVNINCDFIFGCMNFQVASSALI